MLGYIKKLFGIDQPKPETVAPYKVEQPKPAEPAKCGCGRSKSGFCEGLHKLSDAEWAAKNAPVVETKPAKAPAKPRAEKKPAEPKKPAPKKPAKPRAPKNTAAK